MSLYKQLSTLDHNDPLMLKLGPKVVPGKKSYEQKVEDYFAKTQGSYEHKKAQAQAQVLTMPDSEILKLCERTDDVAKQFQVLAHDVLMVALERMAGIVNPYREVMSPQLKQPIKKIRRVGSDNYTPSGQAFIGEVEPDDIARLMPNSPSQLYMLMQKPAAERKASQQTSWEQWAGLSRYR